MKGPRPKSTATRKLTGEGKTHPERINKNEPVAPSGAPDMPEHLDAIGADKWRHLMWLFEEMGMLNKADGDLIEAYCVTYSGFRKALESVNRTGQVLILKSDEGKSVEARRNPFSVELHKYMDRMAKLLAEMGLTPSSRSRVVATPKQEDDPFAEWMKRGGLN